jgi:hypothetical protein
MMIKLYRGLIDILTSQCESLNKEFITHIRTFNGGGDEQSFGSAGFWNLLLEIVYILYVKSFVAFGILMTVGLAIVFFPLYALFTAIVSAFSFNMRFHQQEQHDQRPEINQQFVEPKLDKK